jgi:3(or 17)beta-hydroxysteroid dehydrogenase
VTGGASGIGRETCLLFAREGAEVLVTDINNGGAQATAGEITEAGGRASSLKLDVTQEPDWEAATAHIMEHHGAFDVLVANAGISFAKPVAEMSLEEWRRVMAVNLDGAFLGTKHAMRAMRRNDQAGSIVIVSSASGIKASPGASAYCAGVPSPPTSSRSLPERNSSSTGAIRLSSGNGPPCTGLPPARRGSRPGPG